MLFGMRGAAAFCLLCLTALGCSETSDSCTLASDCPAGQTCSDGRCLPVLKGDAGRPDGELPDSSPPGDSVFDDGPVWPDTGTPDGGCTGNHNGKIERDELLVVVPASLTYTMGTGITLDLSGGSAATPVWDLTAAAADDAPEVMKLDPVPAWAASDFPSATYVSLIDKDMETYGVYNVTQTRMELLGAISGKQDYGSISYSTPVELLRFPVQGPDSYSTDTYGTGFWGIAMINNLESYDVEVIGSGTLKLPKLSLDTVLVRIEVTQYPYWNPFLQSTSTLFLFLSECYGTVARVVVDGVPSDLSQVQADERWRLATP